MLHKGHITVSLQLLPSCQAGNGVKAESPQTTLGQLFSEMRWPLLASETPIVSGPPPSPWFIGI